jgi:Rv0078B-related antitoxin
MTPEAALEKQVEKYRAMTGEERLKVALELHALSCAIARDGIRHQHPEASADEVERLLRERIALAQSL